ncbi:MAG: AMP-dependent synthetase [Proteobacteria bacterium]|nr:AMP-dependent synthetase [Pseudomonadota bacterium]
MGKACIGQQPVTMTDTANPLDAWTAGKLGLAGPTFRRADLHDHQLAALRASVAWAQQHSPFYRRHLAGIDANELRRIADLQRLPFTTTDDLRRHDPPLLAVSQSAISHVVSLETSGTSGPPKRLYFTPEEQAATRDFFAHGMRLPARPGDRVAILFPGARPGSVGDLLAAALEDLGATPILAGWPADPAATAALLRRERPDVVAGAPVATLAVARHSAAGGQAPLAVRSVLLSADHVAGSLRRSLAELWGCEIFEHYGMTEMGLGGGVDCAAHAGYHLREHELLVEIVDPASGAPVLPGQPGEVVFTTLQRRGLPLLRYRTGDLSRLLPGTCACGSPLARLARLSGRLGAGVDLGDGRRLTIADLDEALFALPGIIDFTATFQSGPPPALHLAVSYLAGRGSPTAIRAALADSPALPSGLPLTLTLSSAGRLHGRSGKRTILEAARP